MSRFSLFMFLRHSHFLPVIAGLAIAALACHLPPRAMAIDFTVDGTDLLAASDSLPADPSGVEDLLPPATEVTPPPRSRNAMVNLINRLVERGVLGKADGSELILQAEEDADVARNEAAAAGQVAAQQVVASITPPSELPAVDDGSVRVTYIPEYVKAQIREEIAQEVMTQAREEDWTGAGELPEWVTRVKIGGDVRFRHEGIYYPDGNDNTGAFPDFNAINTGSPFDVAGNVFSPQLNADQDRQRFRLRVRLGIEANLGEGFTAGMRIATGSDNSPVSTNQSLGSTFNGQGGNFSKYAIWLDRGFIKYQAGAGVNKNLSLLFGRFENPFFSTEIIWDDDLGFDGLAATARYELKEGVTAFGAAGAFPVYNTSLNFSSNRPDKFPSDDKYLYGGQLGVDWQISKDFNLKVATAYYYFDNVRGELSDPYTPLTASDAGNTDNTRPSFAQKGNTYRPLRNIVASPLNNFGTTNQFQYFGLASSYRILALTGQLNYTRFEPVTLSLYGEYLNNLAFDSSAVNDVAVNNRGPVSGLNGIGTYEGGNTAYVVGFRIGAPKLRERWDWNVGVNYRYVESDAVIDGFADSDFGGGGTNLKGYSVYGSLALGENVYLSLRWLSASAIAGPPFENDILQLDLGAKF